MTTPERYMPKTLEQAAGKAVEECGELQAALGKTIRWGWASVNPELHPRDQESNATWVRREMRDVEEAIGILRRFMEDET